MKPEVEVQEKFNEPTARVWPLAPTVAQVYVKILATNPLALVITAIGKCHAPGWHSAQLRPYMYMRPPAAGIYEFELTAQPPAATAPAEEATLQAEYVWLNPPAEVTAIKVYAQHNALLAHLQPQAVENDHHPHANPGGFPYHRLSNGAPLAAVAVLAQTGMTAQLHIHGLLYTQSNDDVVMIKSARPQANDPHVLELHLAVIESDGRMKGVYKPFYHQCPLSQPCHTVQIHSARHPVLQVAVETRNNKAWV
jgi:hypothetical protein